MHYHNPIDLLEYSAKAMWLITLGDLPEAIKSVRSQLEQGSGIEGSVASDDIKSFVFWNNAPAHWDVIALSRSENMGLILTVQHNDES